MLPTSFEYVNAIFHSELYKRIGVQLLL